MVKVEEKAEECAGGGVIGATGPMSSLSSEGSFVILETFASPEGQEPPSVHHSHPLTLSYAQNLDPASLSSVDVQNSIMQASSVSDLSTEEIQKKLQKLVEENLELKDTLHQNNLAMTQQFNTLLMWREEVVKVQQTHKEKFAETKEYILKLQAENKELKKYLEESRRGSEEDSELKAENVDLKGKLAELQQKLAAPSRKERELDELVGQLNRQLETAERAKRQLAADNEKLTAQVARLERELETQASAVRQLVVERDRLKEAALQVPVATPGGGDFGSCLQTFGERLEATHLGLDREAERTASLDSWLQVAAENVHRWHGKASVEQRTVAQLLEEVEGLRGALEEERAHGSRLDEAQRQVRRLYSDFGELTKEWERHAGALSGEEVSRLEREVAELRRALEGAVVERERAAKELRAEYEAKLAGLSSRVKTLEAENEAIPVLRTQVELFRADFDAERESRGNLANEKEKLVADLRTLQKRNEELLAQINAEGSDSVPGAPFAASQQSAPTREERQRMYEEPVPTPPKYYCPVCNCEFKQLDILNHHIESCLANAN